MLIHTQAFARAGLVGNPSDGYFGKTISFIVRNFKAEVVVYETPDLEILPNTRDHSRFDSISALAEDVRRFGYYGGIRLLKATIKRFHDYCRENRIQLDDRNFTIRYRSDIPSQVGMAGSSAIITAGLRALLAFYGVNMPRHIQPNVILSVETRELGIPAGLQDRVIQVYEGLVYMDFNQGLMERQGSGYYEAMDPALLPPLYVAYRTDLAEGTEVFHNDIRGRFNRGEPAVVEAMKFWADLTDRVKECLLHQRWDRIGALLNSNFDKRREIYRISEGNVRMVDTARSVGASAKFTGSGGAIVGTYADESMFNALKEKLEAIGVQVIRPVILPEPAGVHAP
jgi:glucuronokinase